MLTMPISKWGLPQKIYGIKIIKLNTITFMGNRGHAKEFLCEVNSWTSHPYRIRFSFPLLQLEQQKF